MAKMFNGSCDRSFSVADKQALEASNQSGFVPSPSRFPVGVKGIKELLEGPSYVLHNGGVGSSHSRAITRQSKCADEPV